MKLLPIFAVALATVALAAFFSSATPNNSITVIDKSLHHKIYYDRIEPEPQVRVGPLADFQHRRPQ